MLLSYLHRTISAMLFVAQCHESERLSQGVVVRLVSVLQEQGEEFFCDALHLILLSVVPNAGWHEGRGCRCRIDE